MLMSGVLLGMDTPIEHQRSFGLANRAEAFTATKQAVFSVIYGFDPAIYNSFGTEASNRTLAAYQRIMRDVANSTAVPPTSNLTITAVNTRWEVLESNPRYIFMDYSVRAEAPMGEYRVSIEDTAPAGTRLVNMQGSDANTFASGQNFRVMKPIRNLGDGGSFGITVEAAVETMPVWHGRAPSSDRQDYAVTGPRYEDGRGSIRVHYSNNTTRIIIIKQDGETEAPLAGVVFELLDAQQNVIYSRLVTDSEGRVEIGNLLPGRYYIREIETLAGYVLLDQLIAVSIGLNETITVVIDNNEEVVTVVPGPESDMSVRRR